jgi:chemotaxis protein MotA
MCSLQQACKIKPLEGSSMLQKLILGIGLLSFLALSEIAIEGTSILVNLKSALLVLAGTLLSALIAYPLKTFKDLRKSLKVIFSKTETDSEPLIREMEALALIWRRYGIYELENAAQSVDNVFLRKGVELVVDGYNRFDIRNVMEKDYELYFSRKDSQVNILKTLAKLAPVFGFVGTIIGLINVLNHMQDPAQIGEGMALALLTTLYGILMANFLFLPLSKKLSEHIKAEATVLNIVLEGILDIADQKTASYISRRLTSYLDVNSLNHMHTRQLENTETVAGQAQWQQEMAKARA